MPPEQASGEGADCGQTSEAYALGDIYSMGSSDNIRLLREQRADLAPVHIGSSNFSDDGIRIITPLYYGPIYILVHRQHGITSIGDLRGKRISLGPEGLGMRDAALAILQVHGIQEADLKDSKARMESLQEGKMDEAINPHPPLPTQRCPTQSPAVPAPSLLSLPPL